MKISGTCNFCNTNGEWEAGIWDAPPGTKGRNDPRNRPRDWAAFYPTHAIPPNWRKLAWSRPEFCKEHNIVTVLCCPKCNRKEGK